MPTRSFHHHDRPNSWLGLLPTNPGYSPPGHIGRTAHEHPPLQTCSRSCSTRSKWVRHLSAVILWGTCRSLCSTATPLAPLLDHRQPSGPSRGSKQCTRPLWFLQLKNFQIEYVSYHNSVLREFSYELTCTFPGERPILWRFHLLIPLPASFHPEKTGSATLHHNGH